MRLTNIYTKIGDKGTTMLASGEMVPKSHIRIDAYGEVDELNACVALLVCSLQKVSTEKKLHPNLKILNQFLLKIQNELFDVGGELATPLEILNTDRQQVVKDAHVNYLEKMIDEFNAHLEPLSNFVLPGGSEANSYAHLCRTVCRRAERTVVKLAEEAPVRRELMIYLNRLSDAFFVIGRIISKELGHEEKLWEQRKN